MLPDGDLPVGLLPNVRYQEFEVDLAKGGVIIVYTDGVTDALNSEGEEFGEARLIECCNSLPEGADAQTIGRLLTDGVKRWTAEVEQFDDTTMIVLSVEKCQPQSSGSPDGYSQRNIVEPESLALLANET